MMVGARRFRREPSRMVLLAAVFLVSGCADDEITALPGTRLVFEVGSGAGFFDALVRTGNPLVPAPNPDPLAACPP